MDGKLKLNAEKLRSLRKKSGLSQEALADQCFASGHRVSLSTIKRGELGRPILYRTAKSLALFFKVDLSEITFNHAADIVGRDYEMQQLGQALGLVCQQNLGRVVLIRGETGIGKTHLLNTFCASLANKEVRSVSVDVTPVNEAGSELSESLRSLLLLLLGINDSDSITVAEKKLAVKKLQQQKQQQQPGQFNKNAIFSDQEYDYLLAILKKDTAEQKITRKQVGNRAANNQQLITLLLKLLNTSEQPLVIVADSLDQATADVLSALSALAAQITELPILLLLASRIEADPITTAWRSRIGSTPFNSFDLPPLNKNEALTLISRLNENVKDAEACQRLSGGNPLFLEQLLSVNLSAAKQVETRQVLPAMVVQLIESRLQQLSSDERQSLLAASVVGDVFALPELCFLLDVEEYNSDALMGSLLLSPAGSESYRFSHPLVRECIYLSMPAKHRARLHKKLAAWFEGKNDKQHRYHLECSQKSGEQAEAAFDLPGWSLPFAGSKGYKRKKESTLAAEIEVWQQGKPGKYK